METFTLLKAAGAQTLRRAVSLLADRPNRMPSMQPRNSRSTSRTSRPKFSNKVLRGRRQTAWPDAICNHQKLAFIETDEDGVIRAFNAGAERLFGYVGDEVIDKVRINELQDPELSAIPVDPVANLKRRNDQRLHEADCVRCDGGRFPALVSISPLHNRAHDLAGYLYIIGERPERPRVERAGSVAPQTSDEEASNERQELFRQVVVAFPEALWIRDAGSPVLHYLNSTWETLTGRPVDVGDDMQKLYEAFHPDDLEKVLAAVKRHPNGGADLECRILLPNGTVRWVHSRTFPIADSNGRIYRVAGIMGDITPHHEEAERLERLKDEFVATVSHELRTPMTSIAGSLALLIGNAAGDLPESAIRMLTIAHNNSQRLVRLISDILDIEKIESGKVEFDLRRVDVRALVEQSMEAMRAYGKGFGVRLVLDGSSADGEVCADPDRLVQVFTNLLSNAVKFSSTGQEVVVAIESLPSSTKVWVRDHGCGIPDAFKPHVFEKFAQADTAEARNTVGSTGLGLSIGQQIVTRLGGEIGFQDAPGGGTEFFVSLPAWDYLGKTRSLLEGRFPGARVLLCADAADLAAIAAERLRQAGFATELARSASEALDRTSASSYEAILMDLKLARGDHIAFVKKLRARQRQYSTLLKALSVGPETTSARQPVMMLDIIDWLDKRTSPDELKSVLDRLIVPGTQTAPRILIVDDDAAMRGMILETLRSAADLTAVGSAGAAYSALDGHRFDLAVLNLASADACAMSLLAELRDKEGEALPIVVVSSAAADIWIAPRMEARVINSTASIDSLIRTLQRRFFGRPLRTTSKRNAA
jgi:PAS domain S-box-containing protein